mgnify:CR=1 FL=1
MASAACAPMSLLGGLAASAPAAGGYDMPEGYVAGSLDEPHQLRELRASGAAVLVTVECASAALSLPLYPSRRPVAPLYRCGSSSVDERASPSTADSHISVPAANPSALSVAACAYSLE